MELNLNNLKKVYVIGIKGSGVIGVVEIFKSMGIKVTGSDTEEKFFTDKILERLGIEYFEKFSADNVPEDADLIIYSTAYNENNNVEMKFAKEKGFPMAGYPEMLALLFNQKYGIAVAGTHGKTTTSAWLANTLEEIGKDPSAIIGSRVANWGGNALSGKGEIFVAETDEYQNKLGLYYPKGAILTSADWDHPDFFETPEDYKKVFKDFVVRIPKIGFLAVYGDSTETLEIAEEAVCDVLSYGFSDGCDYKIHNLRKAENEAGKTIQQFNVLCNDEPLGDFRIGLVGRHNVLNATAVIAVCYKLQLDMEKVREALGKFKGTARRFEYIGERNGAILIDDYGHHPEEIKATLSAAREVYPDKKIWAVFHPHTFTRTKALLHEFAQSFSDADKAMVLDIYGSARETQGGVHSKDLVNLINKYDREKAEYISTIDEATEFLKDKIGPDDVVIAIGAGNVWEVADKLRV